MDSTPHMLNPKELKDGLVGDAWREPRENPGLGSKNVKFVLHQEEVETEAEVEEEEEIFLLKKKKVEDNITEQKQQQVNQKLKRDGSQQKKGCSNKNMIAKVIKKEVVTAHNKPLKCKKTDGRKWRCGEDAAVPHTLCEKHLHQSRSCYNFRKEAHGVSSNSASQKASASSDEADPWKASSSSKRARTSAPSSITGAALASDAPASSKAAPPPSPTGARPSSKQPRKRKVDDYSGGAFYYPEPFGPFRGKQRGNYSSSNRVEASIASGVEDPHKHK